MTADEALTAGYVDVPDDEHAVQIEDAFFRTIVDTIDDGVVALDESGTIVYANPGLGDILRHPPSSLENTTLSRFVPDDLSRYQTLVEFFSGTNSAGLDGSVFDLPVVNGDGDRLWLSIALTTLEHEATNLLVGVVRDVSERHQREEALERYERIIETIDDGVYVLDEDFTIRNINDAVVSMTGYSREELIGSHASLLASDDLIERAAQRSVELLETDRETATIVSSIATKDGGSVPIETRFSLYSFEDDRIGQLGVVRDISDRKQFEETLAALHDSTRELLAVESSPDVSRRIVETATDVIDLDGAVMYLFDADENVLRPTACAKGKAGFVDDWPTLEPRNGTPWRVFIDDQEAFIGDDLPGGTDTGLPIESGLCVPLGDHGVFVAAASDRQAVDTDRETLVRLLAASAEEVLSRLDRESAIRERDRQLELQNQRLRRLDKVNAIIRDIDQVLVDAESTDEIAEAVCDRLVDSERIEFAWLGERNQVEGAIQPRAWSGNSSRYLDDVDCSLETSREPTVSAVEAAELTVVSDVGSENLGSEPWRKAALSRNYRSVLSVPLTHGDVTHGVLTVYANETGAFEAIQPVFSELGETIANAMNGVTTKRALLTDSQTELGFCLDSPDGVLQRFARATGGPIEVEGVVPQSDNVTRIYFVTGPIDPTEFRAEQERAVSVNAVIPIAERDDNCLFEAVVSGDTALSTFASRGAKIRTVTATGEEINLTVGVPNEADISAFVDFIGSQFRSVELVSKTERDRPIRTPTELRSEFEHRLTDRQMEVLRVAYFRGFFEWPRESTGQEIADSLDISQPTVNRHLRTCERKFFTMLFEE